MGYIHINHGETFKGIELVPFLGFWKWKGKIISKISGKQAGGVINTIKNTYKNYPHIKKYSLIGPNSNTYTQWILEQFPEWKAQLPWNAFGANYNHK